MPVWLLWYVFPSSCVTVADLIQAYLFDNDDRFFVGWKLDKSWIMCTVSWSIAMVSAGLISLSAFAFPEEGDYELIPSERYYGN